MPDSLPPEEPSGPSAPHAKRGGRRISGVLMALAETAEGERISFGEMIDAFAARAYGPLIVLFAAPNVLPVALPGISAVLGAPLILLTAQLALGMRRPWLPGSLRRRSLARTDFARLVDRIAPRLHRIERLMRPRLLPLTGVVGKRMIGVAGLILALVVFLPVPFGNSIPGLALVLMAVGLLGRDGLAVIAGAVVGLVGLAVASGFIYGAAVAGSAFVRHFLGA
ncbi:MAG: exopolysaccharide biosynthesis protein [Amaricoccus sp.]